MSLESAKKRKSGWKERTFTGRGSKVQRVIRSSMETRETIGICDQLIETFVSSGAPIIRLFNFSTITASE